MKRTVSTLVALAFISAPAFANHEEGHEEGPCKKIKEACEAAGFKKNDHKEKKGLILDCMKPLMEGKSVAGVSIPPGELEACKKRKEEMKEHHGKGAHHDKDGDKSE